LYKCISIYLYLYIDYYLFRYSIHIYILFIYPCINIYIYSYTAYIADKSEKDKHKEENKDSLLSTQLPLGSSCSAPPGGEPAPPPVSVATPSNLVTSDITARSFRVTWTHAAGQVEKYRVVYYPASGGQPDEKVLTYTYIKLNN